MKYILALDKGTTSSRSTIFDKTGRIKAMAQREFPQIFPKPGWVEHDPEAIWKTQLATAKAALRNHQPGRNHPALGSRNGRPIHHAIVWQDRRTAKDCDRLKAAGWEKALNRAKDWED